MMGRHLWLIAGLLGAAVLVGDMALAALRGSQPVVSETPSATPTARSSASQQITPSSAPPATPEPSFYEPAPSESVPATPDPTPTPSATFDDPCAAVVAEELDLTPDDLTVRFAPIDIYRPPGRVLIEMGRAIASTEGCWGSDFYSGSTVHVVPVLRVDADRFLDTINAGCIAECYVKDGTDERGWTKLSVPDGKLPGLGLQAQYVLIGPDMVALVQLR